MSHDLDPLWVHIDPELHERRVNRTVGAPVFALHHTRPYYIVRALVRAVVLTILSLVALAALTTDWSSIR